MSMGLVFEKILTELTSAVEQVYRERLVSLVIFGSLGRGRPGPTSDVDLLLIANGLPKGRMARVSEFEAIEQRMGAVLAEADQAGVQTYLSPIFKTPEEVQRGSPLFLDMVEDARLLIDRGGFFAARLGELRSRMKKLGSKRVWRGNRWYWVLKPDLRPGEVIEL